MAGWIYRIIGISGLVYNGEYQGAILAIIALIVASLLPDDSFWRWILGTAVIMVGVVILFQVSFWVGLVATTVLGILALSHY